MNPITIEIPRNLLPKQFEFINSPKTFKLYSGAFGAGKSLSGAHHVILKCLENPKSLWLVCCQTYPMLKDSVIRTLMNELELYQKQFKEKNIKINLIDSFNRSDNLLTFYNGSQIIFRSADDESKFKSINLEGFWIDEAVDVDEDIFLMLQGRLRGEHSDKKFGILTTNPSSKENWVYKKFIAPETKLEDSDYFFSSTYDNKFLPQGFIKNMENSFDDDYSKRYLKGEWGSFKGLVYKEFSREKHIFSDTPDKIDFYIAGYDDGTRHPCCLLVIGVSSDVKPKFYVLNEFYQSDLTTSIIAEEVLRFNKLYNFNPVFADPSGLNAILEFRRRGIEVTQANNNVSEGIKFVKSLFHENRLFISSSCKNLIRELENYKYRVSKGSVQELPVKSEDDCVDSLRYGLFSFNLQEATNQELTDAVVSGNF